jgi:uncharacterized protein YdhG (YjbR/CyaY superfamily)
MGPAMSAKPQTIDEYLAPLSPEKRAALEKLRRDIKSAAPEAEECISYQMPAFRLGGRTLVYFGGAKNHCAFYAGAHPVEAHKDELRAYDTSKGTIRFPADRPLPAPLVRKLVKTRIAEYAAKKGLAFLVILFLACAAVSAADTLPVDQSLCDRMKAAHVLNEGAPVGCDRLRVIRFSYIDFNGQNHDDGQIMVLDAVADNVQAIFRALEVRKFPLAKAKLMDEYGGNDDKAMDDNNTSSFNDRPVTGGSTPSLHAYGLAIDVNPVQNPYIQFDQGKGSFSPKAGADYANRLNTRPAKPIRSGMAEEVVDLFAENGFLIWGGYWDTPIDYQHFQVHSKIVERLAKLPPDQARSLFSAYVDRYRSCRALHRSEDPASARAACVDFAGEQSLRCGRRNGHAPRGSPWGVSTLGRLSKDGSSGA